MLGKDHKKYCCETTFSSNGKREMFTPSIKEGTDKDCFPLFPRRRVRTAREGTTTDLE